MEASPKLARFSMGFSPLDKDFYKPLILLALPIALQSALSFGVNMLDGIMVGSLGDAALSSVNLANQIAVFLMMFVRGVSAASAMLIAQYWGKQDLPRIKSIFGIGMKVAFLMSLLFTVAASVAPAGFMQLFSADAEVIAVGAEYLSIVCWSYILFTVTDTLIAMLRNVELVRIGLVVTMLSCLINLGGNYVLIFGKLGFPALGVRGAAIATVLTRAIELSIVFFYTFYKNERIRLRLRDLLPNDKTLWRDFLRYGGPVIAGEIMWGLVGVGKSVIMGHLGKTATSAYSVAETALQLATLLIGGLAAATAVLIGKSVGAKQYDKTRLYAKRMQIIFFLLGILSALLIYFARPLIISLYAISPEAKALAMDYLLYGALTIWATGYFASCFQGINRGAGDASFVVTVNLVTGWLIVLPLSAIAAYVLHWPPPIVFLFTRGDQILKVFIAYFRLRTDKWIRNLTRE